jgi:hypothetical protein
MKSPVFREEAGLFALRWAHSPVEIGKRMFHATGDSVFERKPVPDLIRDGFRVRVKKTRQKKESLDKKA